jgi:hypothetical protein
MRDISEMCLPDEACIQLPAGNWMIGRTPSLEILIKDNNKTEYIFCSNTLQYKVLFTKSAV